MSTSARYDLTSTPGVPAIHKAAALRALGFTVRVTTEILAQSSTSHSETRWYVTSRDVALARLIVMGLPIKSPADQRKAQLYRTCIAACDARARVREWVATGAPYYREEIPAVNTDPEVPHSATPVQYLNLIAAAIAVGHTPRPELHLSTGQRMPSLLFTAPGGTTLADLGLAESIHVQRQRSASITDRAITLPGAEPEEHPWCYARHALDHLDVCTADAKRAAANPTGLFRGQGGRSAAISTLYLNDDRKAALLEDHLAGRI